MKIRNGFVSNSSSSSFVCDLCGRTESGWDMSISDAGMICCVNEHIICEDEIIETYDIQNCSREEKVQKLLEYYDYCGRDSSGSSYYQLKSGEFSDEDLSGMWDDYCYEIESEMKYEMPEKYCPICQMHEFANSDISEYLLKKTGYTREAAFDRVKEANKRRKKLYDNEYIMYAMQESNLQMVDVIEEIRSKFTTYKSFKEYIN